MDEPTNFWVVSNRHQRVIGRVYGATNPEVRETVDRVFRPSDITGGFFLRRLYASEVVSKLCDGTECYRPSITMVNYRVAEDGRPEGGRWVTDDGKPHTCRTRA